MSDDIEGTPPESPVSNLDEVTAEVRATPGRGGWWTIEAPQLEEPEKVRGEDAAKERVAELVAEASGPLPEVTVEDDDEGSPDEELGEPIVQQVPQKYTGTMNKREKTKVGLGKVKMTRIILEENDDIPPTGLYVGVNGRGYMIATSVEVDVPDFILEVLDHAVKKTPVVNPQTKQVIGWRDRMRFPYRVVK